MSRLSHIIRATTTQHRVNSKLQSSIISNLYPAPTCPLYSTCAKFCIKCRVNSHMSYHPHPTNNNFMLYPINVPMFLIFNLLDPHIGKNSKKIIYITLWSVSSTHYWSDLVTMVREMTSDTSHNRTSMLIILSLGLSNF